MPDPTASGIDTFSYAANDCPTNVQDWSANNGNVRINIVPTGFSGQVVVDRHKNSLIDLSVWSVSTDDNVKTLNFTITSLPAIGENYTERY